MKLIHCNKGAVAVEFALVLAFILLPLFLGLVDAGRLMNAQVVINRAAREGAVSVMRGEPYINAVERVITDAGFDAGDLSTSIEVSTDESGATTRILMLSYTLPNFPIFHLPGLSFPDTVTAQATYQLP
ncbi:TadE family protein [Halodesulfovibrio aestuarii]|uniref:TadE family protein n=1 Tax=Halodesulfovibrio aestuarii TaxID=126333 RepID=A0A8G2C8G7_9BACT|nr:TadE/TadG family type IV pilus assembly protein [Halodesulfovibrio aestuarii]SHI81176.1 TadE-like protein [Halodesulfovibrio aestuarii]